MMTINNAATLDIAAPGDLAASSYKDLLKGNLGVDKMSCSFSRSVILHRFGMIDSDYFSRLEELQNLRYDKKWRTFKFHVRQRDGRRGRLTIPRLEKGALDLTERIIGVFFDIKNVSRDDWGLIEINEDDSSISIVAPLDQASFIARVYKAHRDPDIVDPRMPTISFSKLEIF